MSKRHAASRRRNYGRRQHEVAERRDRDLAPDRTDAGRDDLGHTAAPDVMTRADLLTGRLHFAAGS